LYVDDLVPGSLGTLEANPCGNLFVFEFPLNSLPQASWLCKRSNKIITMFGGAGFLGRTLIKNLLHNNFQVQVVSRNCHNLQGLEEFVNLGLLKFILGDIRDPKKIEDMIGNSYAVTNLIGILFEKTSGEFFKIHGEIAKNIAQAASNLNVEKLIHISALGIDKAITSRYAKSKLTGETEVLRSFHNATIIRPSIIFGIEDNFFNQFARMAKYSLFLPLIGGGITKFQPVFVDDVAQAIVKILNCEQYGGKIFELTGPQIYNFKEIMEFILKTINKKRLLLPIPFKFASIIGKIKELLPKPLLTSDQVELLKYNNINSKNYLGFEDLGILPKNIEDIVPLYLNKYK
jgi:NADH dehydrogenase